MNDGDDDIVPHRGTHHHAHGSNEIPIERSRRVAHESMVRWSDGSFDDALPDLVAKAVIPDYALGNHMAPLGLEFSSGTLFPERYKNGAFIGEHGSWNRNPRSGYKVVFVPFEDGHPMGGRSMSSPASSMQMAMLRAVP